MKTFFTILCFPFLLLRAVVLSPWGLIAPITLLVLIFALRYIEQTPQQLAGYYAAQFAECDENEIPTLINVLIKLDDAGIGGLVQGFTSERESVFNACRDTLQSEYERRRDDEHFYQLLSSALLKHCGQFHPAAQCEAVRFIEQILSQRTKADRTSAASLKAISSETTSNCEQLLVRLNSTRRTMTEPNRPETAAQSAMTASLRSRTVQPVLVAANGKKFEPQTQRQDIVTNNQQYALDRLSVPRAERIAAFQRSGLPNTALPEDNAPLTAAVQIPVRAAPASTSAKIAHNYNSVTKPDDTTSPPDITESYRNEKLPDGRRTDSFIPPDLRDIPLDRLPNLPVMQLMQMLHHPNPNYVMAARKTLTEREGFLDTHLKLAWRLYHPSVLVRQEIIAMLPHTANVQPEAWLAVLLDDPSSEVRYQTAAFLATGNNPALQKLLIEHAKRDTDSRIVDLADRLLEAQRNIRR
ncbi:MAG: HEAT repeat domain-containing protein [Planctomycetaceae bacterium]|jgi:hypothetical protein|nr:HEAT repeat domain-containing protein [Planctomycetaceae bacterium]